MNDHDLKEKLGLIMDDEGNYYDLLAKDLDDNGISDRYDNDFKDSDYLESTYDIDSLHKDDKEERLSTLGMLQKFKEKVKKSTEAVHEDKDKSKDIDGR